MSPVSGVILAGGRSSRLGTDKAFLTLGGLPLIERVLAAVRQLADDIIIVTNTPDRFGALAPDVRLVGDAVPRAGALVGLYSGLLAARHERALVVGCDMPFLNLQLLCHLVAVAPECDVVIPRHARGTEALHAVYSRSCLPPVQRLLARGNLAIVDFFPEVQVCYVDEPQLRALDPDLYSFLNINTPADWALAQQLAQLL